MVYNNCVVEYLRKTLESKLVSDEIFHMVMELPIVGFQKTIRHGFQKYDGFAQGFWGNEHYWFIF